MGKVMALTGRRTAGLTAPPLDELITFEQSQNQCQLHNSTCHLNVGWTSRNKV